MNVNHLNTGYGWCPDLPDERDLHYLPAAIELPVKIDLRSHFPPAYSQGQLGSCTANAVAGAFQYELIKQHATVFMPSILFIYYNERLIENDVHHDSGAQLRSGLKTLKNHGVCPEELWPYDIAKFAHKPHINCYNEGLKHQLLSYHRVKRDLPSMKTCLAEGYAFIFGFTVYESFESSEVANSGILNLPAKKEKLKCGHAVVAVGYDDPSERFIIRNCWGTDWGQKGYFTMPYEYLLNEKLAADFWHMRLVEG